MHVSTIGVLTAALLAIVGTATVVNSHGGAFSPPSGCYTGTSADQAMSLTFDFDASAQDANVTLTSFGKPFPTCTKETWVYDIATGCTTFPAMSRPLHSSPDCMVDQLQLVWITKFNLTFVAAAEGAPPYLQLSDNGYSMALFRCNL